MACWWLQIKSVTVHPQVLHSMMTGRLGGKKSLNMYGMHVLGQKYTFFMRFSTTIFHANIQLNKTFISRRPVDGLGCLGLFGQIALLTAKEKYVQVLKYRTHWLCAENYKIPIIRSLFFYPALRWSCLG